MICENCDSCISYGIENDTHKINCKKSGQFKIHETHVNNFQCDEYAEYIPEEPPKDNVMIVLSFSGRDFLVRDERFHSEEELRQYAHDDEPGNAFIKFGQIWFKKSDIAAYAYIGD